MNRVARRCRSLFLVAIACGLDAGCGSGPEVGRPIAQAVTVSPPSGIDSPVLGLSATSAHSPAMAFDGTNYLVVWQESRNGTAGIYGTRVTPAGAVLDAQGIALPLPGGTPALAWNGTEYLVVSAGSVGGMTQVMGARVLPTGALAQPGAIAIATLASSAAPAVASDGSGFLVAWQGNEVDAVRVSGVGAVIDAPPIRVATAAGNDAAVTFHAGNYWLAWTAPHPNVQRADAVNIGRIRAVDGAVLDGAGIIADPSPYWGNGDNAPSLACAAGTCLVAWIFGSWACDDCVQPSGIGTMRFRAADGVLLDNLPREYPGQVEPPTVATNGAEFMLGWSAAEYPYGRLTVFGTRVATNGALLALELPVTRATGGVGYAQRTALTWDGTNYLFAWENDHRLADKIFGARVTPAPNFAVIDATPILISTYRELNTQYTPAAAFDGTNHLVVWFDTRNGNRDIYGARVAPDGTLIDQTAIAIATAPFDRTGLGLAFDGNNYLVAWSEWGRPEATEPGRISSVPTVFGVRVSPAGAVLGMPMPISQNVQGSDYGALVGSDGTSFIVAWGEQPGGPFWADTSMKAAQVLPNGTIGNRFTIAASQRGGLGSSVYPSGLSCGGGSCLALYDVGGEVRGKLIRADGTVQKGEFTISSGPEEEENAVAAFDGNNWLVVWHDGRGYPNGWDLYGTRVRADGTVLDGNGGIPIATALGTQWHSSVAFDGRTFLVAWTDGRATFHTNRPTAYQIYGARLTTGGAVLDPAGLPLVVDPEAEDSVSLSGSGGGQAIIAYQQAHTGPPSPRVHVRVIDDVVHAFDDGQRCVAASDCKSGFCADGYCCMTACREPCGACNVPGHEGTCTASSDPPRGNRADCWGDGTVCAGSCDGISLQCTFPPNTLACSVARCEYGFAYTAANCDGIGRCASVRTDCAPYICGATECTTSCQTDADCAWSGWCNAGRCVARLANGGACTAARQCQSNTCADGYCCDSFCSSECKACNVPGHEGTCTFVVGQPVNGRTPCAGAGTPCAGACDGQSYYCVYPARGTPCGAPASCTNGNATAADACDYWGGCIAGAVTKCMNGCAGDVCAPAPVDMGPDLTAPDMTMVDMAKPDLTLIAMPDIAMVMMPDLAEPDLAMPDMAMPDLAMPDLVIVETPDLTQVIPPDLTQVIPPDLTQVIPPDLAQVISPDLTQVTMPDLATTVKPDLARIPADAATAMTPPDLEIPAGDGGSEMTSAGCGCKVPGGTRDRDTKLPAIVLLLLGAFAARRRRRRA